jgi:hypothetical protein
LLSLRADEEDAEEDEDEVDATSCAAGSKGRFDRPAADTRDAMLACASSLEATDKVVAVNAAAAVTSCIRTSCSAELICVANTWQRLMVGPHIDVNEVKSSGRTQAFDNTPDPAACNELSATRRAAVYMYKTSGILCRCPSDMKLELDADDDDDDDDDADDDGAVALAVHWRSSLSA